MAIKSGDELGKELLSVLGLPKNTVWFELRCAVDEVATVVCEYYPEIPEIDEDGNLVTILAKYRLEKIADDMAPE